MSNWTLALDESGRFEGSLVDGERDERVGLVVGGVLCPGSAEELDARWRSDLKNLCRQLDVSFPPHGYQLSDHKHAALLDLARTRVSAAGGVWLFLVEPSPTSGSREAALTEYVRMLAECVDFAARISAQRGASVLDLRPAQRSIPLAAEHGDAAERSGLGRVERDEEGGDELFRAFSSAEVRQALDAVGREQTGWLKSPPAFGSVDVLPANYGGVHPGVLFADLGCNEVYRRLRASDALTPDDPDGVLGEVFLSDRDSARRVRGLDRHLRTVPPDLVGAAEELEWLEGAAAATRGLRLEGLALGSKRMGAELWEGSIRRISTQLRTRGRPDSLARALAGRAGAVLAAKSGAFEGVSRALESGWAGSGILAQTLRNDVGAQELQAKLWRLVLECANHRGDVVAAREAAAHFRALLESGRSYVLLAERLHVENLAVVSCQNELPASETDLPETRGRLEASTKDLVKAAEDAGALIAIAFGDDQDLEVQPDDEERALWAAARFDAPRFVTPDMERGRSLGTAARSHAFLGSLDEALTLAFRARSLFWGSAFDLTFNASVIARIELERARLGDGKTDLIGAALTAAGVNAIRKTARLRDALSKADGSIRFVFDLVLRALLWAPEATGAAVETWLGALNDDRLYELLATGSMRSHPTELVARHAAELLTRHGNTGAAERWFQLSIALSDAAGETSTIRRLGVFTRRLYDGSGATGSLASSTNPRFEYR